MVWLLNSSTRSSFKTTTGREPALQACALRRSQVALMLTHLVKVPLMLRPAALEDIPALMLLQGNSGAVPQVSAHF